MSRPVPGGKADAALGQPGDTAAVDAATRMGREHVRGSALFVVGRVASMVFTITTQVLIVRYLSKADYGAFAYALALAAAGRTLLSLGQGQLLSRFMAVYEERREYGHMFGSVILAVGTVLFSSTVLITVLFAFSDGLIGTVDGDAAVQIVLLLAFLAPLEALDQIFISLLAVFSRPKAIFVRKYLLTPGLRLTVVLLLVATGAGVLFLAVGYLAAQFVGVVVYVGVLFHVLKERGLLAHLKLRELRFPVRAVFGFSVPLLTGELVVLSINTGNTMLLALFHGAEDVANYRAVVPAATLNKFVFTSFVTLFLPMAARLFARGDLAGMRRSYWTTAALLAVFTFPVFAMTGPFAGVTTPALFGTRYADAAVVLAVLSVGYFVNSALGFNTFTLQVYGRLRFLVILNVLVATLNLAVAFVLIPGVGALGAAIATCITLVVQNVVQQLALCRTISTSFIDRAFRRPYVAIAAATVALGLLQITLSPPLWLSLVIAGVASLAVLFVSRRALDLADTFPELRKLPLVARLLS